MLAIWSFFSQVLFSIFLILELQQDSDTILLVLIVMAWTALLLSYLCNLLYLVHYLQIWNDVSAPGITRHWLELWSWILIALTMTMGGVYVALELCNSIIIPIDVFSMHLSHSELVRVRKDKFITTVLIQDIPILLVICLYIAIYQGEECLNGTLFADFFSNGSYMLVVNVLLCTLLSIIITTAFRVIRRNYAHDNPIAQYKFSFTLKSNEWQSYWIHSHAKIQKCFKMTFALRKLSLTIIDQCSESFNSMKIEGRLLYDPIMKRNKSAKFERIDKIASGQVTHEEMREIGLDLLQEFKKEFSLSIDNDIRIDHLTIKPIPGGECVYDHRTCVQILCVGLKDCCLTMGSRVCPRIFQGPTESRMAVSSKSPGSRSSDGPYAFQVQDNNSAVQRQKSVKKKRVRTESKLPVLSFTADSSTRALPMISVSSPKHGNLNSFDSHISELAQSDDDEKGAEPSVSTVSRSKLNAKILFADVYQTKKINEDPILYESPKTPSEENTKDLVESYQEMYHKFKENQKEDVDAYGFSSKRKINFLSQEERVDKIAGKAPKTFSMMTNAGILHGEDDDNSESGLDF